MINKAELLPVKEGRSRRILANFFKGFKKLSIDLKTEAFLIHTLAFFISRASIMDGLTPFGIGFLSAYIGHGGRSILIPLISMIGLLSVRGLEGVSYIAATWTIYMIFAILRKKVKLTTLKLSIISALVFTLCKGAYIAINDYYLYDMLITAFEGVIVFTLTYIFTYSISTIKSATSRIFSNEELICGSIMLALAVSGVGQLSFLGFSLKNIIGIFLVMLFSYIKGPAIGTTVGVVIGLITSMSTLDLPLIISVYGFSGLLSGLFKEVGKLGSVAGFVMGNFILSFYLNGFNNSIIGIEEIIVASIGFIFLSMMMKGLNSKILVGVSKSIDVEDRYSERLKEVTNKRLREISKVFEELGQTFKRVADKEKVVGQKDVSKFVDSVAEDVCKNCAMCNFCWNNDFYSTYHSMFEIMGKIELNGEISEDNLPETFKRRCIKPKNIIEKCNYLFDVYKLNYKWENKILESRQLVSQQLEGVSKIIKDLANELHRNIRFKEDIEKEIFGRIKNNNIDVKEVIVTESEGEEFEIFIDIKTFTDETECLKRVLPIVSDIVGFQLIRDKYTYAMPKDENTIRFKLIKANRYGAITKVAKSQESFNYISGDSYTFGDRANNYFVALSDGMGVGQKANLESDITISLLEKFLEAGFDKELALKTINSILVLKSNDEMLATIDMSIIDLYMGKTQFIKIGSAPTFIKRKNKVQVINSHSLPVGILKDVDFQVYEESLEDGDFIIMMSDGIMDANEGVDDKEKWVLDIIEDISSINPQTIADEIMDKAIAISNTEDRDDMTVLVTKVWKRR